MNAADVLDKAADVIVERGWCQGEYANDDGQVCALGAIGFACNQDEASDFYPVGEALGRFVRSKAADGTPWPAAWNDADGRTADEVITALRECAASLRATS